MKCHCAHTELRGQLEVIDSRFYHEGPGDGTLIVGLDGK